MLIDCAAYEHGRRLSNLSVDEINEYLARPDCFVWVALKDATPDELEKMQEEFFLHELAVEDARKGHQRPKIEEYGSSLFVVLQTIDLSGAELLPGEVAIFVAQNYILTVRNRSQQGFIDVRARCEQEPEQLSQGPAFVLYALMDAVVDRYFPVFDALEEELETIEEQIFTVGAQRATVERLYQLKRKATTLKHAVAPLLEAVGRLQGGRVPQMFAGTQEYFRDVSDHLYRLNTSIDTMRDTINTAIQVNLSMVTIDESEVNKRLAAWAAIFAVATAFAGIWGMNFKHMPELEWKYGYPMALLILVAICGYLYYRFKKSGWL
jgi:magnesium transporter